MVEGVKIVIVARDKVKAAADLAREIWENRGNESDHGWYEDTVGCWSIPDGWWERAEKLFGSDKISGDEDGHGN